MKRNKHILITGGAGFIGSHLCTKFVKMGCKVICVDNILTGNTANVAHLVGNSKFRFINHDVTRELYLEEEIEAILHFASPASPLDYLELPIQTLKVGALGTHKMLGMAKFKKAIFLTASTSEVYGDPKVHPQKETYWGHVNPVGPRGVYDEAKRYAEALVMAYHRVHKIPVRIVRIFNTYGPKMRLKDGRAVPAFISQALTNSPITVFGDGSQTRSFCYIDDMVKGIIKLLGSSVNSPVNIGNPSEVSILEIAELIKKVCRSRSRIIRKPLPADDPKVRQPDISLAKKYLKWKPSVNLETGIKKTVSWFKANTNLCRRER